MMRIFHWYQLCIKVMSPGEFPNAFGVVVCDEKVASDFAEKIEELLMIYIKVFVEPASCPLSWGCVRRVDKENYIATLGVFLNHIEPVTVNERDAISSQDLFIATVLEYSLLNSSKTILNTFSLSSMSSN